MSVPSWVQDAIFYQIFPDRFANGDPMNDPSNVQAWGTQPSRHGFQGGDLRGVIQKLDYLNDLGINTIYFNPIFLAHSNHRYDTVDYYQIDHRLGNLQDFKDLIQAAHAKGIRIILDGVFNHCGRGFFGFTDLLENGYHSAYRDWFHVRRFPLEAYTQGKAENYLGWWDHKSLPKFNTDNPYVREYLMGVAEYWIREGADGWRLDVPNEIDDDTFWAEFRHRVKTVNPEAYLLGEIWTQDKRWVGEGHFDGLMNYPLRETLLDLLNGASSSVSAFSGRIEELINYYPRENCFAMFLPLSSHDTERILTVLANQMDKVKMAFAFYFAFPGAPCVYYGDEVGMTGGKDPECRAAFPWDEREWKEELHAWVRTLTHIRKDHAVLRMGDFHRLVVDDTQHCYAFARTPGGEQPTGTESIAVVLNASSLRRSIHLNAVILGWQPGDTIIDLCGAAGYSVIDHSVHVELAPWSTIYLKRLR